MENATHEKNHFFMCCGNITFIYNIVQNKISTLIVFIFKNFANFWPDFYIHSGNFVALAVTEILKLIWLEIMMNTIPFINIQNGR